MKLWKVVGMLAVTGMLATSAVSLMGCPPEEQKKNFGTPLSAITFDVKNADHIKAIYAALKVAPDNDGERVLIRYGYHNKDGELDDATKDVRDKYAAALAAWEHDADATKADRNDAQKKLLTDDDAKALVAALKKKGDFDKDNKDKWKDYVTNNCMK